MIDKLKITVSNVQFVTAGKDEKVHVHFRGADPDNQLNINGYVPVTKDEFYSNSSDEGLKTLVKDKLLKRLK